LYISMIAESLSSEVKPPMTYTPSFKFTAVTSVRGLGIGVPTDQPLSEPCPYAKGVVML
jgi:hypothetical protein